MDRLTALATPGLAQALLLAAVVALWWSIISARWIIAPFALCIAATVADAGGITLPSFYLGDLLVLWPDMLAASALWTVAVAFVTRKVPAGRVRQVPLVFALLLGLLLVSLLRGVAIHGLPTAVNEARIFLGPLTLGFYATLMLKGRDISSWIVGAGCVLVPIGLARAVLFGLGAGGGQNRIRALPSSGALLLAFAGIWCLMSAPKWAPRVLPLVFFAMVVILQHRSVWVTTIVMLAVAASHQNLGPRVRRRIAAAIPVLAAVLVLAVATTPIETTLFASLETSLNEAENRESSTWIWRTQSWAELTPHTATGWVTGRPIGAGYERQINGLPTNEQPHNYYVATLLAGGLLAVALFVAAHVLAIRRSSEQPALALCLIGLLVFYVPYTGLPFTGLLLGVGLAQSAGSRRTGSSGSHRPSRYTSQIASNATPARIRSTTTS